MERAELQQIRVGRNYIRVGDVVGVRPSRPGRRDGFDARVRRIVDISGRVEVEVIGGRRTAGIRTFFLERIERRHQTRAGAPVEHRSPTR